MDGLTPACFTEAGCLIPPPGTGGRRALELRSMINRLGNLIDPGTVCKYFAADQEDLELLAVIEDELKEAADGEGYQTTDRGECGEG